MLFLDNFLQNFQIKQKQDLKLQQPNANPAGSSGWWHWLNMDVWHMWCERFSLTNFMISESPWALALVKDYTISCARVYKYVVLQTPDISRSNTTRYWTQYERNKAKTLFRVLTHKRQSFPGSLGIPRYIESALCTLPRTSDGQPPARALRVQAFQKLDFIWTSTIDLLVSSRHRSTILICILWCCAIYSNFTSMCFQIPNKNLLHYLTFRHWLRATVPWRRHYMETLSTLLVRCEGNPSDHSEIWQATRQHCCRYICQIAKWCDNSNCLSRSFETSRDLTIMFYRILKRGSIVYLQSKLSNLLCQLIHSVVRPNCGYLFRSCSENNKSKCTAPDKIKQDSIHKRFGVLTQDIEAARFGLNCSNRSKIWQAPRRQHCRDACQNFRVIWSL